MTHYKILFKMTNCQLIAILVMTSLLSASAILQKFKNTEKGDTTFATYLLNATKNYATWLQTNQLDPTKPIVDTLLIESRHGSQVLLKCELRNQQITGLSSNKNQKWEADSYFEEHVFVVSRFQNQTYTLEGNFVCTGLVNISLEETFPFSGQGTYQLNTSTAEEHAVYIDVGVTDDYKLDFNLSDIGYGLYPTFNVSVLSGTWNDSLVPNKYITQVVTEFAKMYVSFLRGPIQTDMLHLHPSRSLLTGYITNITQGLDLTTILAKEDLPSRYNPTLTPPTVETTTTSKAALPIVSKLLIFLVCSTLAF